MLKRVALVGLLTIIGMAGQFVVRAVITASVGPSAGLDVFFITLGWAGAASSAIFQVTAMVLAPRALASDNGNRDAIRALSGRIILLLSLVVVTLALLAGGLTSWFGYPQYAVVVCAVLIGWGLGGGWLLYMRQFMTAWSRPVIPAALALLPPLVIIVCASLIDDMQSQDFALIGGGAWLLAGAFGLMVPLARGWRTNGAEAGAKPEAGAVTALLRSATPVYGAHANSQINQRCQDALAAWTMVGGTTIFSNAVAMARLQQVVADALFMSSAYPAALQAIGSRDQQALRSAYRLALRVQLAVSVPTALAVWIAGDAAAITIYAHGNTTMDDARAIAEVLYWTAPAMIAVSLQSTHAQLLVALGKTRAALQVEILFTVFSLILAVLLIPAMGLPAIAAGASLALIGIQFLMLRILKPVGLQVTDTMSELLRACWPGLLAAPLAWWLSHLTLGEPALRALAVGVGIIVVTLPFSALSIRRSRNDTTATPDESRS